MSWQGSVGGEHLLDSIRISFPDFKDFSVTKENVGEWKIQSEIVGK